MKWLKTIEPYRLLFPIGTMFGALGVYVWIANAFIPHFEYPGQLHSKLMLGTFLFSFAAGFLMPAIPKMTASFAAQPYEMVIAFVLVLTNALCAYLARPELFYLMSATSIFGLIVFFGRRFRARTKSPPPFFPFVLLGLLSGLSGAIIMSTNGFMQTPPELFLFAKKIYFEGMILFLVLGIGSRLIPVISGRGITNEKNGRWVVLRNVFLGLILVLAFAFEGFGFTLTGGVLKSLIVSWVAFFGWGLLTKSQTKSRLAFGMRISGLMVLGGIYMSVLQPSFAVHWMHLTYIAGFGLMTLTVATRVTLAHGSYDLTFEKQSSALWICGALILTAAATRVAAPFIGSSYFMHLAYAAMVWIAAIGVWGIVFVKRMIWKGEGQASC
ncbi:MAG: NnrS family protein [Bdellovibrionota bacterium]